MDYYNDCMKRQECLNCENQPHRYLEDTETREFKEFVKQQSNGCNECIELPPKHYFNQMPSSCGSNVEYSCLNTGFTCPQHNASPYEWIFSLPNAYRAQVLLRDIIDPDNCLYEDEFGGTLP